jgi:hypothetical protein
VAFLYSLANNVAAQSSNLGIVSCFSGATFDVEQRSSQDVFLCCLWSECTDRLHRLACCCRSIHESGCW